MYKSNILSAIGAFFGKSWGNKPLKKTSGFKHEELKAKRESLIPKPKNKQNSDNFELWPSEAFERRLNRFRKKTGRHFIRFQTAQNGG